MVVVVVVFFFFFSFFSFSFSSCSFSFFLYSLSLLAPLILASLLIFAFTREAFRLRQRTPAFSKVEKKKKERRRDRRDPNGIWTVDPSSCSHRRRLVIRYRVRVNGNNPFAECRLYKSDEDSSGDT